MMVEVLKQAGTWHVSSEVLKMPVSCVHESGPAALRGFCLLNSLFISLSCMESVVIVGVSCCEEAPAVVGEGGLVGWSWWMG